MAIELFFGLIIIGLGLILFGFFLLVIRLYQRGTTEGFTAEANPVLAIALGFLNWKRTKAPLLMLFAGLLLVGAALVD